MENENSLKDDLLTGAQAIADYIGEDKRKAYYLLENGLIPGRKRGAEWISRKSSLDQAHTVDAA